MGVRDTIAKAIMGIKAFHSSPHDFDRFDLKKIGTGEGAQVYGHGIYAAENPAVSGQGGQYWQQFMSRMPPDEQAAAGVLRNEKFDRQKAIEYSKWNLDQLRQGAEKGELNPYMMKLFEERQRQHDLLLSGAPVGPRTYEVNIKADPAQMLDWDKALNTQPHIAEALRGIGYKEARWPYSGMEGPYGGHTVQPLTSGEDVYRSVGVDLVGRNAPLREIRQAATERLRDVGIPGIKYLDEGSRRHAADISIAERAASQATNPTTLGTWQDRIKELGQTPLTNNYVVFDPANIDILKKYGIAGAAAAPVLGSAFDQGQYQENPP